MPEDKKKKKISENEPEEEQATSGKKTEKSSSKDKLEPTSAKAEEAPLKVEPEEPEIPKAAPEEPAADDGPGTATTGDEYPQFEQPGKGSSSFDYKNLKGKQLTRSTKDKYIGGVCGGFAEYLGADPLFVRIAWAAAVLMGGIGFLLYIASWVLMPEGERERADESGHRQARDTSKNTGFIIGVGLLFAGFLILSENLYWHFGLPWHINFISISHLIPLVLIGVGVYLLLNRSSNRSSVDAKISNSTCKVKRSIQDRKIGGVCGGIAEYLKVDSVLIRIAFVFCGLVKVGAALIIYVALMIFLPENEDVES